MVRPRPATGRWAVALAGLAIGLVVWQRSGVPAQSIDLLPDFRYGTFIAAGADPAPPLLSRDGEPVAAPGADDAYRTDAEAGTFTINGSGTFIAPLRPTGAATALVFEARHVGPSAAENIVELRRFEVSGRQQTLGALLGSEADGWAEHRLESDRPMPLLLIDATLGRNSSIEFRGLRLEAEAGADPPARAAEAARETPNIVIIILDAARAGNFGAYGYERDTTPFIDQLAAGGLVFRHAYSECPNTSCSIPNIISGLPFIDVSQEGDERRIDDRITTLAESLRDLGYWTVGIAANPNNSAARNSSQGFAEFHEMWVQPGSPRRHPMTTDPYRLSERAIEAIRTAPDDQPLFMQLHYVPPHEPYDPRPEFDIFGDPAYDGPLYPGMRMIPVRSGELEITPADVDEMMALYDGNLRMADDAVQQVFDVMREEQRWDDTVVLITSDHGEAFFEHGVHGHNSTLFDEMLHIPFILRLPRDATPDLDLDRLVTNSDITPTMLGLVGLEPAPGVYGVDLLNTAPDRDRVVFHRRRTSARYVARTLDWKAHYAFTQRGNALFDLTEDPDERRDVRTDHPLLYRAFRTLLDRHLAAVAALELTSEQIELTEEDRELLRSLGYVR